MKWENEMRASLVKDMIREIADLVQEDESEESPYFHSVYEAAGELHYWKDWADICTSDLDKCFENLWSEGIMKKSPQFVIDHATRLKFAAEELAQFACCLSAMCSKVIQSRAVWGKDGKRKKVDGGVQ